MTGRDTERDGAGRERLQKRLARAGVASRRAAEALIAAGRVTVNGEVATLCQGVLPSDEVRVNGALVDPAVPERVTFALYKPAGYVTTAQDEYGRRTVLSAMPRVPGLHPVGRLDKDSEGLLLLTTDGELTLTLTHPRYGHEKAYRAWTTGEPGEAELRALEQGVPLEDGPAQALSARPAPGGALVTLGEGRNRQVRRMLEAVGHPVTRLLRYRIGGLWLGDLGPGEYRELSGRDLHDLLNPRLVPRHAWARSERELLDRWG